MTDRIDLVRFQRAITTTANGTVVTGITAGANGSTTQLVLDSAGNVGIGATTGLDRLTVRSDQNTSTRVAINNQDAGSSAEAVLRLSASGATWDVAAGSAARNTNALTFGISGTERMRISSAGVVTTPFQSAIRLNGNNGNGFELGGNTQLLVSTYYNSVLSRGDLSWNSTTGRITAATAGYYAVMFQVYVQTGGTNNNGRLQIRKNGSEYQLMQTGLATDGTYDLCTVVQLSVNDYIDIIIDSFDPMRLYMGPSHTVFHMFFLG